MRPCDKWAWSFFFRNPLHVATVLYAFNFTCQRVIPPATRHLIEINIYTPPSPPPLSNIRHTGTDKFTTLTSSPYA